ncbi:MAG TPA: FixH family protein [Actinoplanes sp.]|jgi:hypothetical protein
MKKAVALVVAVVALLGWLLRPDGSGATTLHAGTEHESVTVVFDRPRLGQSGMTISLTSHDGRPVTGAFIRAEAVMPLMGYATPEIVATAAGSGRYTVGTVHLMTTGPWELHLRLTTHDETTALVLPFQVTG